MSSNLPAKVAEDGEVRAEAGERKTGAAWIKLGSGSWYEAQLASCSGCFR